MRYRQCVDHWANSFTTLFVFEKMRYTRDVGEFSYIVMEKEIKIILGVIIVLIGFVLTLALVEEKSHEKQIVTQNEWNALEKKDDQFTDSSHWRVYTSEEYAYEMKYPSAWEFNLTDGTTFYPEICARNKYDKCIGRVTVGVYPDVEEDEEGFDLQNKCDDIKKVALRNISGYVWMCEEMMSDEFAITQGFDRKKEYYFKDNRGSVFEINISYVKGESTRIEEEMVQTIKLKAK